MSDQDFILPSTTKIIASGRDGQHLYEQKLRVESAVTKEDPAEILDTSKALLETTYKTILKDLVETPDLTKDMNGLYKEVKTHISFNHDDDANKIIERLVNGIAHNVPELRNKYGALSHGKDGNYQSPIEMPEAEMVAHLVDGTVGFLLKKNRMLADPRYSQRIYYADYEEFNDFLDTSKDPVDFGISDSKEIPFSWVLFNCDPNAYKEYLLQFSNPDEEEDDK